MQLTHEHEQLRQTFQRWITTEVNPHVDEWEREERFPARQVFKQLAALGLLGLDKPEENGGSALDYSYPAVIAELMGEIHSGGVQMGIGVQTDMCTPALAKHGSAELRAEFLTPAISGDYVGCIGVSESGAGSDVAAIRTKARKDGGDYVINGEKTWITNGTQADFCCLLANTSDGSPHANKSLIIVPMKTKGVSVSRKIRKIGMHASDTAQLHFDDVRVPQRYLIGQEGSGFTYQMEQFQSERLWAAMQCCSMARRAIRETIAYTQERKVFGRSVLSNQVVHFAIAEMQVEVEALSALCWKGVEMVVRGEDATPFATMAKLKGGRLVRQVADACLQYWGGMGYADESSISRIYRDVRLCSIAGGADEVMLQVLCKVLGILPKRA
ncbi:acyl-CoA dehydrogenase family protein [Ramlibacter sp. WS9]|uniref:acyl-CoA dehydrogenase family protein n=1 Tax=Ramlibacter sp. WS9 TaxID=1882741 RepID=UPI00114359D4|nr:acyl-CoA dehydrogenase family protein [Ramlibacter sp. WS9]ROZ68757.1 acyl-CoA dehydrogenase [Ramlibacter sp. WS9]